MSTCTRCAFSLEAEDLRCALCGLVVPADAVPTVGRPRAEILRCTECGAATTYSPEAGGRKCAYCGALTRMEAVSDPVDQAHWAVAFGIDPAAARGALAQWLSRRGFFRPRDLAFASTVENLRPVWWPAWLFDAHADVCWTADTDHGAHRAAWAPCAGRCGLQFNRIAVSASRGLSDAETRALVPGYDLTRTVTMDALATAGPPGATLECFDTQRSAARKKIVEAVEATAVEQVTRTQLPGSRSRNVKATAMLTGLTTTRVELPAYVLAYRYQKKVYRVVIHGQNAGYVQGSAPLAWGRIVLVALGVAAVIAVIVILVSVYGSH